MAQMWDQKAAAYWAKAKLFVANGTTDRANPPWFELRLGDQALSAWAAYFKQTIGSLPAGMLMLESRKVSMFLVPCEQPEWFDVAYAPPKYLMPWPPKESTPSPEAQRRIAELARSMTSTQDVNREQYRRERDQRARERSAEEIIRANAAAGIETKPGTIPVSDSLRRWAAEHAAERAREAAE